MAQMPEAIILRKTEETKTGVTYCMADVKTNADRIRSMSDKELAMWINDVTTNALSVLALGSNKQTKTLFYWLNWLKQEAE